MVVLKKVKASTLMETLVATVLIVVIFMMSSLILNNVFSNSVKSNTQFIENRIRELRYLELNQKLHLPYEENINNWEITIDKETGEKKSFLVFTAQNVLTNKQVIKIY